ncbi:hypothetical protein BU26DRAFT_593553 [Trematosphaeria pertusa]|uniref:CCHC-type domain-containing protein n=1 Tax=Trematosphaeria pertusa TaxID=390896 RepID=A0A6A6IK02_9PLEO|nr:uncharacterized protein BU26DRAFT_593553 [Trematosphaeria pertusa]KAF2249900.1 hypothetical protein BU26DRAFT_593553 [Trematosphaeria pertusa]
MASLEDAAKFDSEPYFFLEGRAYAAQPWDSSFDPYLCQKCGKPGHKEHGCLQEPHCWFCARGDHRKDHCPYLVNGDGRTGARCPNCGGDHPTWAFNKCRSEALAKHKHDCYVKSLSGPYWLPLTYTNGDGTWPALYPPTVVISKTALLPSHIESANRPRQPPQPVSLNDSTSGTPQHAFDAGGGHSHSATRGRTNGRAGPRAFTTRRLGGNPRARSRSTDLVGVANLFDRTTDVSGSTLATTPSISLPSTNQQHSLSTELARSSAMRETAMSVDSADNTGQMTLRSGTQLAGPTINSTVSYTPAKRPFLTALSHIPGELLQSHRHPGRQSAAQGTQRTTRTSDRPGSASKRPRTDSYASGAPSTQPSLPELVEFTFTPSQ